MSANVKTGFAYQDIQSLLAGWFHKERESTISDLEEAISAEKEIQIGILKEEISKKLVQADKEIGEFSEVEIEIRRVALEQYTKELVETTEFETEERKRGFIQELDEIIKETMEKLEKSKADLLSPKD